MLLYCLILTFSCLNINIHSFGCFCGGLWSISWFNVFFIFSRLTPNAVSLIFITVLFIPILRFFMSAAQSILTRSLLAKAYHYLLITTQLTRNLLHCLQTISLMHLQLPTKLLNQLLRLPRCSTIFYIAKCHTRHHNVLNRSQPKSSANSFRIESLIIM